MAVGDVYQAFGSVNASNFLTVQPNAGVEVAIHNIYHEAEVELYYSNGTYDIKFDADSSFGVVYNTCIRLTNTYYLKIKNVNAGAKYIACDGVVTK
jgi:hypothetical protein